MHSMRRRLVPGLPWLAGPALLDSGLPGRVCPTPHVGADTSQLTATVAGEFSHLSVLRTSTFPQNHIPPFAATVTVHPPRSDQLYVAIEKQLQNGVPRRRHALPGRLGRNYDHLAFHYTTSPVLQVDIETGGCQGVSFGGKRHAPESGPRSPPHSGSSLPRRWACRVELSNSSRLSPLARNRPDAKFVAASRSCLWTLFTFAQLASVPRTPRTSSVPPGPDTPG